MPMNDHREEGGAGPRSRGPRGGTMAGSRGGGARYVRLRRPVPAAGAAAFGRVAVSALESRVGTGSRGFLKALTFSRPHDSVLGEHCTGKLFLPSGDHPT